MSFVCSKIKILPVVCIFLFDDVFVLLVIIIFYDKIFVSLILLLLFIYMYIYIYMYYTYVYIYTNVLYVCIITNGSRVLVQIYIDFD